MNKLHALAERIRGIIKPPRMPEAPVMSEAHPIPAVLPAPEPPPTPEPELAPVVLEAPAGPPAIPYPEYTGPRVDFLCNICGNASNAVPLERVQNRECQSCLHCGSSLRMRSVIHTLSLNLFGKSIPMPSFPVDKTLAGLGMSDWDGYALGLTEKLAYTNTFYHMEPRLDITAAPEEWIGKQRFLISSDVFEHIPVFALDQAFENSRRLLCDGGVFIFTVPNTKDGETKEHFPRLHDFNIVEEEGRRILHNTTIDGEKETFDDLIFHGGDGMTLEMRMFSEPDLRRRLKAAGFSSVQVHAEHVPEYGILWPMDWAVPFAARA